MRIKLLAAVILLGAKASAQNYTTNTIIEGGKTLVELVRVFKIPKNSLAQQNTIEKKDSCAVKSISDLCIKNSTGKSLMITLFKRTGNGYEQGVLTAKILPRNQECWYELKSGVYKFKLETDDGDSLKLFREGELKLNACANMIKEIKEN